MMRELSSLIDMLSAFIPKDIKKRDYFEMKKYGNLTSSRE